MKDCASDHRAVVTRMFYRVIGRHPLPPLFGDCNKEAETAAASRGRKDVTANRGKKDVTANRSKKDIRANRRAVINTPMIRVGPIS